VLLLVAQSDSERTVMRGMHIAGGMLALAITTAVTPASAFASPSTVPHAKLADTAKNARAVDKLSASKRPKPGQLLALDATGKFPIGGYWARNGSRTASAVM
jgi:hypothetical protein